MPPGQSLLAVSVQVATALPVPMVVSTNQAAAAIHVQRLQSASSLSFGSSPLGSVQVSPGTTQRSLQSGASSPGRAAHGAASVALPRCQTSRLAVSRSILLGCTPAVVVPAQAVPQARRTLPVCTARMAALPAAAHPPTSARPGAASPLPAARTISAAEPAAPAVTPGTLGVSPAAVAAAPGVEASRAAVEDDVAGFPCVPQFQPPSFFSPLPIPESPDPTPLVQQGQLSGGIFTFVDRRRSGRDFSYWPPSDGVNEDSYEQLVQRSLEKIHDGDIATTGTNDSGPSSTWTYTCSDGGSDIGCASELGDESGLLGALEALTQSTPAVGRALTHSKSEQAMAVLAPHPRVIPRPELGRPPLLAGSESLASLSVSPLGSPKGLGSLAFSPSLELCSFEWTPAPGGADSGVLGRVDVQPAV